MKKEGHPDYHFVEVVMTDGSRYKTRSTVGKRSASSTAKAPPPLWPITTKRR